MTRRRRQENEANLLCQARAAAMGRLVHEVMKRHTQGHRPDTGVCEKNDRRDI